MDRHGLRPRDDEGAVIASAARQSILSVIASAARQSTLSVVPAQAGTQCIIRLDTGQDQQLGPGLRRDDRCDEWQSDAWQCKMSSNASSKLLTQQGFPLSSKGFPLDKIYLS